MVATVATTYVVKSGDCIASIGMASGFFPDTLWQSPANADLKALRKDGNVLFPGDVVAIPDLRPKSASCATGRRHDFRRRGVPEILRIALLRRGKPRADIPYDIEINGRVIASARTDAEGRLQHYVPPDATSGRLILSETEAYDLALGYLAPASTESGARARLMNLDLLAAADADAGAYAAALTELQIQNELEPTGILDEGTQQRLIAAHGR